MNKKILTDKSIFLIVTIFYLLLVGCSTKPNAQKYDIKRIGDTIRIQSGIQERELVWSGKNITTSKFLINGERLNKVNLDEIQLTFHEASPNKEPKGIEYSSVAGVEQKNAVKNQTDALSIKKKKNNKLQEVKWVNPTHISKEMFGEVFNNYNYQVTQPNDSVKHLTLIFTSGEILKNISLEINYEIYNGHPAIRKWVKVINQSNQWYKISGLILEQLNLNEKYSSNTLLTPNSRGLDPSIITFNDTTASVGVISASEIPSKLRHLSVDGTSGYNPDYFEWVLGPGESFVTEPIFNYAFSGENYPTGSRSSSALDRCVETEFAAFLNNQIISPVSNNKSIAPVFCTWTNYNANINSNNMREAADVASRIGFKCFQLDAGWSDTGPDGGWAVSTIKPKKNEFPDMKGLSDYIRSKNMKTGLWYSIFINEKQAGNPGSEPVLYSLPLIKRAGGLGLSLCYDRSREHYVNDLVYLHQEYKADYFKQDLSNACYGDIAQGHESRTLKESYLRGLRGLFITQDEIRRQAPDVWLQLSHEIYWETPGPEADIAVLKHADSYHSAPNEYWGAGNRKAIVASTWKYDVDSLKQKLIQGAFRARKLWYAHRGLPLERIEVFGAVTTNFNGSLTPQILDRQICSWLMGAPLSFSGDLRSLTSENIEQYKNRFEMMNRLQQEYSIYSNFQFSGVPAPTDVDWHWWGKLNTQGCGTVIVMRGCEGDESRKINIPWVNPGAEYSLKALLANKELGIFTGKQLQEGELILSLEHFGQEIIELIIK